MSEKKENQLEKTANQENQNSVTPSSCKISNLTFELVRMHMEAAILYGHRYAPELLRYKYIFKPTPES